jgi:type IV pilus assembly protein PilO
MPNLKKIRAWIYAVITLLLLVDIGLVVYLVSPLRARPGVAQQELDAARQQLERARAQAAPLQGMDQKLKTAQHDLDAFYRERFASRASAIATELGKLATANGVQLSGAHYDEKETSVPGLHQVRIEAELDGQYLNEVKFVNALERDKMFFVLNDVTLGAQQGGAVKLQLRMQTFLRS